MNIKPEISVLIPVYNEAEIIADVVSGVRATMERLNRPYEILVIDDGSTDETALQAQNAGARVISHPYNIGNGAAVKTGIRQAKGDILVMMDGDGQHNPEYIVPMLEKIGRYDMVVGARSGDSESRLHRDVANGLYNLFASYICKRKIQDLTSGFRPSKRISRASLFQCCPTLLLSHNHHHGSDPRGIQPDVCADQDQPPCREKQDSPDRGRLPLPADHPEDCDAAVAHAGFSTCRVSHFPNGRRLRPVQVLCSGKQLWPNVCHADHDVRGGLHGRSCLGTSCPAPV